MTRRPLFIALALGLLAACGGKAPPTTVAATVAPTTTAAPTTTTKPPLMPLTGLPAKTGQDPHRPVVAVKVENAPQSRPLSGFEFADIVYEEVVEGGYTRFILLFQSGDSKVVGSVRSVRPVDAEILVQFGHPVIVASGGISSFTSALREAGVVVVTEDTDSSADGALVRRSDRFAPHDLYANTIAVRRYVASNGNKPSPPPSDVFTWLGSAATASTRPSTVTATVVTVPFASQPMQWRYEKGAWVRYDGDGTAFLTEAGSRVTASNVAVMTVKPLATGNVDVSGSDVPSWEITGSGTVTVLTAGGAVIEGTWSRPAISSTTRFLDSNGLPIPFEPGPTWIQLLPTGSSVIRTGGVGG